MVYCCYNKTLYCFHILKAHKSWGADFSIFLVAPTELAAYQDSSFFPLQNSDILVQFSSAYQSSVTLEINLTRNSKCLELQKDIVYWQGLNTQRIYRLLKILKLGTFYQLKTRILWKKHTRTNTCAVNPINKMAYSCSFTAVEHERARDYRGTEVLLIGCLGKCQLIN